MNIVINKVQTKDLLTKSNLPDSDYVINPYVGCPHACKYCYACFMKRFTGHKEEWGTFLDVKECAKPIHTDKLKGKSVFLSSVTDCYNRFEKEYRVTRNILEQLVGVDCQLTISTKSDLVLRDLDLLKHMKDLKVAFSVNTLDEKFRSDMDHGSSISERLEAMRILHDKGSYTVLFMSPIFPYITNCEEIIRRTHNYVDEYWFENLNLRGAGRATIFSYIEHEYPEYLENYKQIYLEKDDTYWIKLADSIDQFCHQYKIKYTNYFYHKKLVDNKKNRNRNIDKR